VRYSLGLRSWLLSYYCVNIRLIQVRTLKRDNSQEI